MSFNITTWNINGIRARKDAMINWITKNKPEVLCLQEVKASDDQIPPEILALDEYKFFWNGSTFKKGYSGTGILVRKDFLFKNSFTDTITIPSCDVENRAIELSFNEYHILCLYVPRGEKDDHYKIKLDFFRDITNYVKEKNKQGKKIIVCGDMNVAHKDNDVYYEKIDEKMCGLRPTERLAVGRLLEAGVIDAFRNKYPDVKDAFTWWPYWRGAKEKNMGWRIDCFYISPNVQEKVIDVTIDKNESNSDHCPTTLVVSL